MHGAVVLRLRDGGVGLLAGLRALHVTREDDALLLLHARRALDREHVRALVRGLDLLLDALLDVRDLLALELVRAAAGGQRKRGNHENGRSESLHEALTLAAAET